MPIAIERLIGEVAKRHDLLLSRDDPVLVTVTLNELVLGEALAQLKASLSEANQEIAASAAKQIEVSKTIAEALITNAAEYAVREIRAAVAEIGPPVRSGRTDQTALWVRTQSVCWGAAVIAVAAACLSGALALVGPSLSAIGAPPAQCERTER